MKKFLFITAISLFLVSCSCEYHYSKLQKNCASFIITNNDTIILPEIHIDTMVRTDTAKAYDTITFEKERVKVQLVRRHDTVFCKIQAPSDTIIQTRTVHVPAPPDQNNRWKNILPWAFCVIVVSALWFLERRRSKN